MFPIILIKEVDSKGRHTAYHCCQDQSYNVSVRINVFRTNNSLFNYQLARVTDIVERRKILISFFLFPLRWRIGREKKIEVVCYRIPVRPVRHIACVSLLHFAHFFPFHRFAYVPPKDIPQIHTSIRSHTAPQPIFFLFIFTAPLLHIVFNNVINVCHCRIKYILFGFFFFVSALCPTFITL